MKKLVNQPNKTSDTAERRRIDVLGTLVDDLTLTEAAHKIISWVKQRRQNPDEPVRLVVTVNPEYVVTAHSDSTFQKLVNGADIITPDGAGLIVAGKLLRQPFQGRVTGVALCETLFGLAAEHGLRIFLLGAAPGVAEEAADQLRQQYPGIGIVGTWAGQAGADGDDESIERIRQAGAEIVLVAYGMLKQDWWSARNLIRCGATVAMGIGGVLDYKAGRVALAPVWIRRWGFEWLYRLYREPWRWRRQLALPRFGILVIWQALEGNRISNITSIFRKKGR